MQTTEPKPMISTIDLAAVFFTEWDHLLTHADKLQAIDDDRVTMHRDRVHGDAIRTTRAIAASLERIGDALRRAHYGEEKQP